MTIPVVLQQFILLLNSLVDRIWIAHIPDIGELAFTASGICVPIIYIAFALAELVSRGIVPQVGWLLGGDKQGEAEHTLGSFFFLDILIALLICIVFETFTDGLVSLFGGDDSTSPLAIIYLRIATPGYALLHVLIPECRQGIVTGAMLAFTLSLDDFTISYFTTSPLVQNLSTLIYSATRRGIEPTLNALSALMFIALLVLLLIVNRRTKESD